MELIENITFANPEYLYGLLVLPAIAVWYGFKSNAGKADIQMSSLQGFAGYKGSFKTRFRHSLIFLRLLALGSLIVAIARPQSSTSWQNVITEGIDIVISIDISSSMLAEDFKPNRLEASKEVAGEFISRRPNDRIGLVVFSGESFTQCPLTTDHAILKNLFKDIKSGMIEDGTAIGMGLATGVNRLENSKAKSKVIILLTDGVNNSGLIAPITAAEIAQAYGIRVYTIGVGTQGMAPYPFQTPYGIKYQQIEVKIDEEMLMEIAAITGGRYFRATDNTSLEEIYDEIDKLEKSEIEETKFTKKTERFLPFAVFAGLLVLLELLLRNTLFRSIP